LITKKIYIVRHGQTDFNLRGVVQGSGIDSSLNDQGRSQAKAFFDHFNHVKFDRIYTSALKRTRETVQSFIDLGIPTETLPALNEISWGNKEGQKITPEEDAYYHWMLRQWQEGNTAEKIEGGESPDDVVRRMKPAIEHILSRDDRNVLICMHGRAIRIILCLLLNYPLKSMDVFEHENLCLYLLNQTGTMFSIEKHNYTGHLVGLKKQAKVVN
jgi:probable phosphoglycerate mutase